MAATEDEDDDGSGVFTKVRWTISICLMNSLLTVAAC
jgi:hypothetical protein